MVPDDSGYNLWPSVRRTSHCKDCSAHELVRVFVKLSMKHAGIDLRQQLKQGNKQERAKLSTIHSKSYAYLTTGCEFRQDLRLDL